MKKSTITKRPWGTFEQFTHNELSTVKIIEIEAGKRLSLQSHQHREEWWIALDDGIVIEIDGVQKILKKGEHAFVQKGSKHRLSYAIDSTVKSTSEKKNVRVLEIAFGDFDEKDIVRYEDDWGRK
ncbi:phosphomannose isomerase type II C-terminal cupin domain [Candidatus Woesearchaeota archaeon]|nr:phosphomannose isomerase type II C-terminal cupin domain [Candidatus Woesearchaeota archaeon]